MYLVTGTDIVNEVNPMELIWKCLAYLDVKSGDQVSEKLLHRRATRNDIIHDEQIESALNLLSEAGLIVRIPDHYIELKTGLATIAEFSDSTCC